MTELIALTGSYTFAPELVSGNVWGSVYMLPSLLLSYDTN